MTQDTLPYGVILIRFNVGPDINEVGTLSFWTEILHQLYAQMPFPSLWNKLKLSVWHMDHSTLDEMFRQGRACLQDYDTATPGYQVAVGLYTGNGELAIAIFPANWQADYTGPARPLTEDARIYGRKVWSHEAGHFYFDQSNYGKFLDDISRILTQWFRANRPKQTENEHEDGAEVYRAVCGSEDVRGTFSDDKPFTPKPELRSFIRCMFWMAANLRGCWVQSVTPGTSGVMYQIWVGLGWEWRWVSADDWHSEKWTGTAWKRI